jgi:predicted PurR-regulated permease PerM
MWGFFVGVTLAFVLYSYYEEWQQHRLDKKRLARMREDVAKHRRWDVAKGQWMDE